MSWSGPGLSGMEIGSAVAGANFQPECVRGEGILHSRDWLPVEHAAGAAVGVRAALQWASVRPSVWESILDLLGLEDTNRDRPQCRAWAAVHT